MKRERAKTALSREKYRQNEALPWRLRLYKGHKVVKDEEKYDNARSIKKVPQGKDITRETWKAINVSVGGCYILVPSVSFLESYQASEIVGA